MTVRDGVRKAGNHPVVEYGARAGYAASGVLHLLLAWLALHLAWGSYGGEADQAGAFEALSVTPVGVGVLAFGAFEVAAGTVRLRSQGHRAARSRWAVLGCRRHA